MSERRDERAASDAGTRGGRKPYEKPAVALVPLRPEEAVLAGCKAPGGDGGTNFSSCGLFGCAIVGS